MLDFEVSLTVIAPEPSGTIRALAREGFLTLETREYAGAEDLQKAGLVIAAANDRDLNRRVAADALKEGILVNAADDPRLCSFFFPALVRRGELVAGLSSSGACPGLTARLREELDNSWPSNLGERIETLKNERRRLRGENGNGGDSGKDDGKGGDDGNDGGKGGSDKDEDGGPSGETETGWREGLNRLIRLVVTKNQ
jgi:siroheme synthase-like protein